MMIELLAALTLAVGAPPISDAVAVPGAVRLEACVDKALADGGEAATCVGVLSGPCQEEPGGTSTTTMVQCLETEGRAWTALMHQALRAAASDEYLEPAAKRALARSQTDWTRGMERSLAVYDGRDGTVWPVVRAGMQAEWSARRYLWIRGLTEP